MKKIGLCILSALLAGPLFGINASLAQIDASRLLLTQNVDAYVSVTDDRGQPVSGLQKDAFKVSESPDGVHFTEIKEITAFKPDAGESGGITFLLLIDNSGSMYDTLDGKPTKDSSLMRITYAKEAVRSFLSSMTNPADAVGLVTFNTFYKKLSAPIKDRQKISKLLDEIGRPTPDEAYTEMYASLDFAAREFAGAKGRKAIIVLSDGENYPYAKYAGKEHPVFKSRIFDYTEPILACQQEAVSVYGINYGRGTVKDKHLDAIAVETGGKTFDARNSEELSGVYQSIHDQVAHEYLLTYRATTSPSEKKFVRVNVGGPGTRNTATRFYFSSTVFGLPMKSLSPLLAIPFILALVLLYLLTLIKLEVRRRPASLEVIQTQVGHAATRIVPLTSAKTVIGGSKSANLTIVGSPKIKGEHATILFDAKDKSYTIVGGGDIMVNNRPVKSRKLETGDVIDVGGATIVFDKGEMEAKAKKKK
jgi:Ca-activated chloride channel family protein